jgi:DNA invertase Pin-like site-specific DNA recombinase
LMLTLLAGVAAWEREIMLERQRAGIEAAKLAGRYKGRPRSVDRGEVLHLKAQGKSLAQISRALGCDRSTVVRALAEHRRSTSTPRSEAA